MLKVTKVAIKDIKADDQIIALMGPTGTGKSTFIDIATKQEGKNAGHSLQSYTAEVQAVRYSPSKGTTIVFVDTPGFDDTHKSDTEILKLIADWLEKTYKRQIKLTGIIYLHRITDNRMAGSPLKNLHLFGSLCGDGAIRNVILVTTMWTDRLAEEIGKHREDELINKFWRPMLDLGSINLRFLGTYESAWDIVNTILKRAKAQPVLLQEELVDLHIRLRETKAGRTLYNELVRLLEEQKVVAHKLREEVAKQDHSKNPKLKRELDAQFKEIENLLQSTMVQIQEMRIPFVSRIKLFFVRKKAHSHPLTV